MRSLDVVVHASTEPVALRYGDYRSDGLRKGGLSPAKAGGAAELFTDGENALGHPAGDAVALAGQIARLADEPALRVRLGKAGRLTAERLYQKTRMAEEMIAV